MMDSPVPTELEWPQSSMEAGELSAVIAGDSSALIDSIGVGGSTPLIYAATLGNVEVCFFLDRMKKLF